MNGKRLLFLGASPILVLFLLACSLLGGGDGGDSRGTVRQWASTASASSEYGSEDWAAKHVTGAPDTNACGDYVTAWASASSNGRDWVDAGFATPVVPKQINIYETYNPGQIVKVEVRDEGGSFHTVWEGQPHLESQCPRVFTINVTNIDFKVTAVLITVDQSASDAWNELDAVELVGTP